MKRRRTQRPEPRTELIGLNLTHDDLAQLDQLFAALKSTSRRRPKPKTLSRSTVAYQCFKVGLDHRLQSKPDPLQRSHAPLTWNAWRNRPKRDSKLVGIYLSETDYKNLMKLDSLADLRFFGRSFIRTEKRHPFQFHKPTPLAYGGFQTGLALLVAKHGSCRATAPSTLP